MRVPAPLPLDPHAGVWQQVPPADVAMVGQAMVLPTKMRPSVASLRVRSVHDGERVAFLLEWQDAAPTAGW
jgi:DMSO reductase family type II enzyme heme b subunit